MQPWQLAVYVMGLTAIILILRVTGVLRRFPRIHFRIRFRRKDKLRALYDEWIDDIVQDPRTTIEELIRHFHHHIDEGAQQGVGPDWLASMENLLEIIRRKQNLFHPTLRHLLERMYRHWQMDPLNTTPPPITKSLRRLMAVLPDPPDEPVRRRAERRQEEHVSAQMTSRAEDNHNYSRWHGS